MPVPRKLYLPFYEVLWCLISDEMIILHPLIDICLCDIKVCRVYQKLLTKTNVTGILIGHKPENI